MEDNPFPRRNDIEQMDMEVDFSPSKKPHSKATTSKP
jgi:hypothetical protein